MMNRDEWENKMNTIIEDVKYYFSYMYIWRQWMFFTCWRYENFGATYFGGFQLFGLKIVPKANVSCEYKLNQYYNTNQIIQIGSYFILFDNREVV